MLGSVVNDECCNKEASFLRKKKKPNQSITHLSVSDQTFKNKRNAKRFFSLSAAGS